MLNGQSLSRTFNHTIIIHMKKFIPSILILASAFLLLCNPTFAASGIDGAGKSNTRNKGVSRAEANANNQDAAKADANTMSTGKSSQAISTIIPAEKTETIKNVKAVSVKSLMAKSKIINKIKGSTEMNYNLKKALIFLLVAALLNIAGLAFWPLWPFSWVLNVLSIIFFVFAVVYFIMFLFEA